MRPKPTMSLYVPTWGLAEPAIDVWQIVGFLAIGLVYTSSIANALVYESDGAKEAAAAGFILLSMVSVGRLTFTVPAAC